MRPNTLNITDIINKALDIIQKELWYRNTDIILKENTWRIHSKFLESGWGNGYVSLPKGHPLFGLEYDTIHDQYDIQIHGGLTYSKLDEDKWVIGFDTAHYQDTLINWPESSVKRETENLKEQVTYLKPLL